MYLSLLYFNLFSGYSPDELLRRGGLHPAMYLSLLYFNLFSGYSPDELLHRGGLHPAMYLHCFNLDLLNSSTEDSKDKGFFLIYQINRVKAAAFD
jgi:hypothetical protein